jgi:Fe-S cluster assembly protein SufD
MTEATALNNPFLVQLQALERRADEVGPDWMRSLRRSALEQFEGRGFPTSDDEAWRNTNVGPIVDAEYRAPVAAAESVRAADLPPLAQIDLGGPRLVFVNGEYAPRLSRIENLPSGVWIGSLADAARQMPELLRGELQRAGAAATTAFESLNTALLEHGAVIRLADGVRLAEPVQLVFASGQADATTAIHPRTLIVTGEQSRLQLVEAYVGLGPHVYLTNAVCHVRIGENGRVEHYRVQHESEQAFHVSTWSSHQGRNAQYASHNVDFGGRLVRHDVRAVLAGEGGSCSLNGLYLTHGRQHVDNHTTIDHAKPHCSSRELYKGILDDHSRSVFTGRIIVRPQAQKTDAKQSNPNLLLAPTALVRTRPQLEIYADDVKCTHGATVGQMDSDALFYLRSRGIDEGTARNLMIQAFAGEVLERVKIPALQEALAQLLADRLPGKLPWRS